MLFIKEKGKNSRDFSLSSSHNVTTVRCGLLRKIALSVITCFTAASLFAQGSSSSPERDARLLNHYSREELNEIEAKDPQKFKTIEYYYTRSFIVENIACVECTPRDTATFDISDFEHLRQQSERVVMTYKKYGIKLTLLSVDELTYKMPSFYMGKWEQ